MMSVSGQIKEEMNSITHLSSATLTDPAFEKWIQKQKMRKTWVRTDGAESNKLQEVQPGDSCDGYSHQMCPAMDSTDWVMTTIPTQYMQYNEDTKEEEEEEGEDGLYLNEDSKREEQEQQNNDESEDAPSEFQKWLHFTVNDDDEDDIEEISMGDISGTVHESHESVVEDFYRNGTNGDLSNSCLSDLESLEKEEHFVADAESIEFELEMDEELFAHSPAPSLQERPSTPVMEHYDMFCTENANIYGTATPMTTRGIEYSLSPTASPMTSMSWGQCTNSNLSPSTFQHVQLSARGAFPGPMPQGHFMNPEEAQAVQGVPDFNGMNMRQIMGMQLTLQEIIEFKLLFRFNRHKAGRRYFWGIIDSLPGFEQKQFIDGVVMETLANAMDLSAMAESECDHEFVTNCFRYGSRRQQQQLLGQFVNDSVLRLARSPMGCRFVQNILPILEDEERQHLVECLMTQCIEQQAMRSMLLSVNGTSVFQTILKLRLPYESVECIGKAIEEDIVAISEDVNGCHVVQLFIQQFGDSLNVGKLMTKNKDHIRLCRHQYGNYVIQCIIKQDEWYSELPQIAKFRNRLINDLFSENCIEALSVEKAGSHVVETCICSSNQQQLNRWIRMMKRNRARLLKALIADRFGNYVVGTLLKKCNDEQQEALVHIVHHHVVDLTIYHPDFNCKQSNVLTLCRKIKYRMDRQEWNGYRG